MKRKNKILLGYLFKITLCFSILSLHGQQDENKVYWNPNKDTILKERDILEIGNGAIINKYIDSLNNVNLLLPKFLDDIYIDFHFYDAYFNYGKLISTRKYIFEKVQNINTLNLILSSENPKYTMIPDSLYIEENFNKLANRMPFIKYSLKDLVKMRLDDMITPANSGL
jgi:hypothetical protein